MFVCCASGDCSKSGYGTYGTSSLMLILCGMSLLIAIATPFASFMWFIGRVDCVCVDLKWVSALEPTAVYEDVWACFLYVLLSSFLRVVQFST